MTTAGQVARFVDEHMVEPCSFRAAGGTVVAFSARSPERPSGNEDAALVIPLTPERAVLAVADGAGGQPGGAGASQVAVESLERAVVAADAASEDSRGAILDGFEQANRAVLERGVGAATTLAVVEIAGRALRVYHVGDSAVMVVGQRGKLKLQTISHSPVGYALESGLLDEQEALHHDERHLVSNVVGGVDMRIEVGSPLQLAPRDTVLLATDGVWDNLGLAEVASIVRAGPLEGVAHTLARRCHLRMEAPREGNPSKPDDLTFVLYRASIAAQR